MWWTQPFHSVLWRGRGDGWACSASSQSRGLLGRDAYTLGPRLPEAQMLPVAMVLSLHAGIACCMEGGAAIGLAACATWLALLPQVRF